MPMFSWKSGLFLTVLLVLRALRTPSDVGNQWARVKMSSAIRPASKNNSNKRKSCSKIGNV